MLPKEIRCAQRRDVARRLLQGDFILGKSALLQIGGCFAKLDATLGPSGGIGRRAWFRSMSTQVGGGSNPLSGTSNRARLPKASERRAVVFLFVENVLGGRSSWPTALTSKELAPVQQRVKLPAHLFSACDGCGAGHQRLVLVGNYAIEKKVDDDRSSWAFAAVFVAAV